MSSKREKDFIGEYISYAKKLGREEEKKGKEVKKAKESIRKEMTKEWRRKLR